MGRLRIRRFSIGSRLPGNDFVAGAEAEHTDIKARFLVPSFLFGVPDEERLMLADPAFAVVRRLLHERGADTGRKPEGSSKRGIS